jgi:hypothetical protein
MEQIAQGEGVSKRPPSSLHKRRVLRVNLDRQILLGLQNDKLGDGLGRIRLPYWVEL